MKILTSLLLGLILTINAYAIGVNRNVQTTIQNYIPLTTTEMNALPSPEDGDVIWNSTEGTIYFYSDASWVNVASGAIDLTTDVTGILPVANGGTGANTLTTNNVILGNGTSAVQFVAPSTSGNVLTSNGTTWTSAANGNGDVSGPASSVDGEVALFDLTTGKIIKRATGTGVAHLTSGVLSASAVVLTSEVSGILPRANGGTGLAVAGTAGNVLTSDGTDWISSPAAAGANVTLSNLTNPTAINQDLIGNKSVFTLRGQDKTGATASEQIWVRSGDTVSAGSGSAFFKSGDVATSGASGEVHVLSGNASGGSNDSGKVQVHTGNGPISGKVQINSGNASNGDSGDIELTTGTATGTQGQVIIQALNLSLSSTKIVDVADPTAAQDAATKIYVDNSVPMIFGSRSTPRNVETAGITVADGHMQETIGQQDIYVCGSSDGSSCDADVTLATIEEGSLDGQKMCLIGRDSANTITLDAGSTTNIEVNGNAVLGEGDTICFRFDLVNWTEVSRNF